VGTAPSDKAILQAVASACGAGSCIASVEQVIDEYASVLFRCTQPNCERAIAYLKRNNDRWALVDHVTSLTPEDLSGRLRPSGRRGAGARRLNMHTTACRPAHDKAVLSCSL